MISVGFNGSMQNDITTCCTFGEERHVYEYADIAGSGECCSLSDSGFMTNRKQ
jgi:hypothetical protein